METGTMGKAGCVSQGTMQFPGRANRAIPQIARMGKDGISEYMIAFVRKRIRIDRGTEEAEAQNISIRAVTIFAGVQQTDSVTRFAQVDPAVSWHFEFCQIPRGVSVIGTRNRPERRFCPHFVRSNPEREEGAKEPSAPTPTNSVMNFQDSRKASEAVRLDYFDVLMPASDSQIGAQPSLLYP